MSSTRQPRHDDGTYAAYRNSDPEVPLGSAELPPFEWEPHPWTSILATHGPAATRDRAPRGTYYAAVPPAIADLAVTVEPDAAAAAAEATQELARFDAEMGERVEQFAPVFLRSESASSSQVERLTASARAIFTAELGAGREGSNASRIVSNTNAMTEALRHTDDLSSDTILRLHAVLMAGEPQHTPGVYRDEPVWIGGSTPVEAHYVAPHHSRIQELMGDLTSFTARRDVPSFTQVVITHGQFESIHPFSDGNGRTGRAIAQAQLRHAGITRGIVIPVSAGILADLDDYHGALDAYRQGELSPLVRTFATASIRAVDNSRLLVRDIDDVVAGWKSKVTARSDSNVWRLLDVLARRPVLTSSAAAAELGVQPPNIHPALNRLLEAGVLRKKAEHGFGSGPLYRADDTLEALDRFAARAGKRAKLN
ncbi:Fic family protein [Microbacterium sp. 77mftsu3.1]|uniref:Fic family protein n=1 Tax=Microbacterium sp. 77mftsu3.1 TaxID=1761802 RepID=UPI00037BA3A9|nr:Fic family protein [Microbacterium sp. 77mftsu3.1]SDH32700.1 Fic family protein [Microbacterium sp. 77mftsu3.1]